MGGRAREAAPGRVPRGCGDIGPLPGGTRASVRAGLLAGAADALHRSPHHRWGKLAFGNDIIGLKADLLRGIRDNLVLSLQEEYGGDLQQNVERATAHFHRAAAEFSALRARFHSAGGLHDPDLDRRHNVAVYLQILEDWIYEGIKWQLLDTNRYGTTTRLTHQENPNQLLALAESLHHRTASTFSLGR
jgi:hypothetical protein